MVAFHNFYLSSSVSLLQLEIDHSGCAYIMEIGKHYKLGLFLFSESAALPVYY